MSKYAIITDSASDLPKEYREANQVDYAKTMMSWKKEDGQEVETGASLDWAADSGGSSGEYIVYCNIDGAEVYFDDAYKGFISGGELKVPVNPSDKPYTTYLVKKDGYTPFTTQISGYPASGQTVKLYSTLTPSGTQHAIPSTPVSPITILTGIALVFLGFACLSKRE